MQVLDASSRAVPRSIVTGAALCVALALPAAAQTTADGRYPVTPAQRQTADQVAQAGVPLSALSPTAPESYTVKSGDTLWGISSLFLTSPWRWPELWGMNKEQVRNPHLIYPGQTLRLVRTADGRAILQVADAPGLPGAPGDTVRLSPRVRDLGATGREAVAAIPHSVIEPFLSQPLVIDARALDAYPRIVGAREGRVVLGRGDVAFVRGVSDDRIENYHVFRPATPLFDPDDTARRTPIAYEAFYLGTARMAKRGEVATLDIQQSKQEIGIGDRLVPIERQPLIFYVPRVPEREVAGRIVSVYGGVDHAGTQSIVAINRGRRDGVEIGHVLALLNTGETVLDRTAARREFVRLPDERIGEMFVFRVFETVSYALIMRVQQPVRVGDRFARPDDGAAEFGLGYAGGRAAQAPQGAVTPGAPAQPRSIRQ